MNMYFYGEYSEILLDWTEKNKIENEKEAKF